MAGKKKGMLEQDRRARRVTMADVGGDDRFSTFKISALSAAIRIQPPPTSV